MQEDRSTSYNNAGCLMMSIGNERVALDLFRAALESKLYHQRRQHQQQQTQQQGASSESSLNLLPPPHEEQEDTQQQQQQRCVTPAAVPAEIVASAASAPPPVPDCLHTADAHLERMEDYIREAATATTTSASMPPTVTTNPQGTGTSSNHTSTAVPYESRGYDPFLCWTPFPLPEEQHPNQQTNDVSPATAPAASSGLHTQHTSAVIVYNLGIIHQWFCRQSPKSPAFYEISAAFLSSITNITTSVDVSSSSLRSNNNQQQVLLLQASLLNNFAVWCFDNGDGDAMRSSLEHLSDVLESTDVVADVLPDRTVQGMRRNIRCLLTPEHGCSPAA